MTKWLGHWTPNSGVPGSKPLDCSKVDSAFRGRSNDYLEFLGT